VTAVTPVAVPTHSLAAYDDRPYFARALDHGLANGIIDSEKLDAMRTDGAKGIVQIADFFGTAHLRTDLDDALKRMVYLASLYLEHISDGNLTRAARSLQDNTFLSHSRGGSEMLKRLYAMPTDSTILDADEANDVREFLRARTLPDQWSVATWRARHAERLVHQREIEAALWFADEMGLAREALAGESAETVINACLLTRIAGREESGLLDAEELKKFLKAARRAKKKSPIPQDLLDDVPEQHIEIALRHVKKIATKDFPRIVDPKVPFADLVRDYHDRFHPFSLSLEVSDYDALVTDEWRRVTRGSTDTDSMNTIFLCLAAGRAPKPAITATEAKAAVRAIRKNGALVDEVTGFVRRSAPHQMIDDLIFLWESEFYPDVIEDQILGDDDDALEPLIRLLAQHCHIKAPAKKAKA
jgi:hypothetical protein